MYNNSKISLTDKEVQLLSLGLNFAVTPNTFPIVEYITATETLCKRLEEGDDEELIIKANNIRHLMFDELKKGF